MSDHNSQENGPSNIFLLAINVDYAIISAYKFDKLDDMSYIRNTWFYIL